MKKKKTKKSNKNERIWDVEKIISETKQKEALLRQGKIAPAQKKIVLSLGSTTGEKKTQ